MQPVSPNVDLRRFRYHTGAELTPLAPHERCPPLFRDVGLEAMELFLTGKLKRLCGPTSPITYLRTSDYREPYTDFGKTGRILLLQPGKVQPWHAGIDAIYVSARETWVDNQSMVFIPAGLPLEVAAQQFAGAATVHDVADAIGPDVYESAREDTLLRLHHLKRTHQQAEVLAAPLRRMFQSAAQGDRDKARQWMQQRGLSEVDLCAAWHHLPTERRDFILEILRETGGLSL